MYLRLIYCRQTATATIDARYNISNANIAKRLEYTEMSNCLLNVVAQHLRFYYAVAESVKNSMDVVFFIVLANIVSVKMLIMPTAFYRSMPID